MISYPKLDLPEPELVLDKRNQGVYVSDLLRKQWLLLTPEEWVRQHVLQWLLVQSQFPATLLSIERQVNQRKRADVVGFNRDGKPLLLVECKAPGIAINAMTAQQALHYNQKLQAPFVWLTNGMQHVVMHWSANASAFLPLAMLPGFEEMRIQIQAVDIV